MRKAARLFDSKLACGAGSESGEAARRRRIVESGEACLQTFGGFGFAREYDVERKWRETRLFRTAPVSTNMVLAYIGAARARHAEVVLMERKAQT